MNHIQPPRLAVWLLHHSISPNIRYGAMGDFEQVFEETAETAGLGAARRWYWRQAIRSLPFFISDTLFWSVIMLKNFLRVALRNLYKNKASSFVNIFGLSLAVGTAITAFLFIEHQVTTDWFHTNGENIFLVENEIARGSDLEQRGDTPIPLGPAMESDIPQVLRAVRVANGNPTFRVGENTFQERIRFVDPDFLDMFSFELRLGNKSTALRYDEIVLSDDLATKYFGNQNPMGEEMVVIFSESETRLLKVAGVARPFPEKSSFAFDALVHFDYVSDVNLDQTDWEATIAATFIEVAHPADIELISTQMGEYKTRQNAANVDRSVTQFNFAALRSLSMDSYRVTGDISGGSHPASRIMIGLIALFLLLLSCINYMNLAVATVSRRLKEIGVRKAMGSSKSQLVGQFLAENMLTCVFALISGSILAVTFFVPGFNALIMGPGFTFGAANMMTFMVFMVGLLLATGLISGAYPAFYISSFRPTAIFSGRAKLGGESLFTKGLLTFQFVLAIMTMIMGVILAQNADFQANRDWGYDEEHVLVLRTHSAEQFSILRSEIEPLSGVVQIAGAASHFARSWDESTVEYGTEKFGAARFDIGEGFLGLYNVPVISGAGFDASSLTATDGSVLVNDTFVKARGWTSEYALGQTFREDSTSYAIAGVVGDFVFQGFYDPLKPAFLRAIPESGYQYMSIRVSPESGATTEAEVKEIWKTLAPNIEYSGFFQDTVFQEILRENTNIKNMFRFIAALALLIACMGLLGLAAQKVARSMKEIGIRKVLGASTPYLTRKINRTFVFILCIAAVIATPLGYLAMDALLGSIYANPIPIGPSPFILSFALVLATAMLTISTQVRKIASANPADVLRSE